MSTTHTVTVTVTITVTVTATGAVVGVGVGAARSPSAVRRSIARGIVVAWAVTLPASAAGGALFRPIRTVFMA